MPVITQIMPSKGSRSRARIYLDGQFAFGLSLNVIARFRLREGMELPPAQVEAIQRGQVRQECFDQAMRLLSLRLQSRSELSRKLLRKDYGQAVVDEVMKDLERLGYVNDEQFARTRALSAAQHKQHGRRRAFMELRKSGVSAEVAGKALDEVYEKSDAAAAAKLLAEKQAPRLRKLDPAVARRRLAGMLQRRGFDYETIKPVIDEVLGKPTEGPD